MSINSNCNQTNYSNGKIYKIVSFKTNQCYVGSTTKHYLSQRMSKHTSDYRCWLSNPEKRSHVTSYEILKHGDADIILLESYPCSSKAELHTRERYWIEQLDTVNKNIPASTRQESDARYHEANKDEIAKKNKEYREAHKDEIAQKKKEYREANRDAIHAYKGQQNQCECGCIYTISHKTRHMKTIIHTTYIANKNNISTNDINVPQQ